MTRPNTEDKNFIYGLTGDFEEMNCWSDTKTAFMAQMWFFGYLAKVLAAPLLERYGHMNFLKRVLIPLNIISFWMMYLSNSYIQRCIGFFLTGFCRLKFVPLQMILRESVETKYSAFATTFLYMFVYTIIVVFCVFIEYFSKNAIYFLHLTNGISIFSAIVYYSVTVESPLKHIIDNN